MHWQNKYKQIHTILFCPCLSGWLAISSAEWKRFNFVYRFGVFAFCRCPLLSTVSSARFFKWPMSIFKVSYELSHITYIWKNDEDTLRKSPSLTTLNAYLIKNATTTCPIKASWRGKFWLTIFFFIFEIEHEYYCYYFHIHTS